MDPNSRLLILGAGNSAPPEPLTEPLLFPMSCDSSNVAFVHGVKTNGIVVGTYQLPSKGVYHGFFLNPYLIVYRSGGGTAYVIDCNNMTLAKTITGIPSSGLYPWSSGKYISVNAATDQIKLLDIQAGSIASYAYAADDGYSATATDHMTVGFANNGAGLFSSLQSRYWWSIGDNSGGAPVYYYYADKTSDVSLGVRTLGFGPGLNYSRTWGLSFNQSHAMFCNIGSNFFRVSSSATSATTVSLSSLAFGGVSYIANLDSTDGRARCTSSSGGLYLTNVGTPTATDWRYRVAFYANYATGGTSPADCGITLKQKTTSMSGPYTEPQDGTFMCQINDTGHVAVAYFDVDTYGANTNQLVIKILNGASTMATVNTSIPTTFTGGGTNYGHLSLNGCSWTTNLLYPGSAYT